jgi:cation diffusion facilitator CzcD-associated flavoprotein CzcO
MHRDTDVLVIGTGFSGLGMSIRLMEAGLTDFIVLEQADGVGGTWRDNHYPGVACDVPSHLYSYSFEANPKWSRLFAEQHEILAYLNQCADKYGVRPHVHFRQEVTRARFDERRGVWEVATRAGDTFRARVLVAGTGGLSRPSFPDIPGRERFAGKTFHTARWDHDYSLAGKRVAVIGTGASAIQVVPSIVSQVGELTLFQRTPPWVLPKPDFRIGKRQQRRLARFPSLQTGVRNVIYWLMESRALGFTNMLPSMQVRTEKTAREFIESQVKDPALRAKLTPDYRIGCKRILMSNEYYAALQAPNASVVTEGIAEIRGLGGLDLNENWRSGAEAYKGTTVSGFPNFFMLMGPNTGLGHNSMVFMIESQIQYVMDSLRQMRERNLAWVDVKPSVQARFNRRLQARMSRSVWATGGCVSWYHTATGKNTTLWPGFTFEFRYRTRQFDLQNYRAEQVKARPAETQLQPTAAVPAE